jgi:hypothetical protein
MAAIPSTIAAVSATAVLLFLGFFHDNISFNFLSPTEFN